MPALDFLLTGLAEHFEVRHWPECPRGTPPRLDDVRGAVVSSVHAPTNEQFAQMPHLAITAHTGAGYDAIDLRYVRSRGIVVTHNPGTNNGTVADHALGLMLAISRGFVKLDRGMRAGRWAESRTDPPTINGMRLGIVGLGRIGAQIARRAAAFDMTISYCGRAPKVDVPWTYYPSVIELAAASDYLVLACPGGPATRHIVNAQVLDALGPEGYLVNVARGSVVDTEALIAALRERRIAGAGLDVIDGEPNMPAELLTLDNVLLTPHVAGRAPNSLKAQYRATIANIVGVLNGTGPVSPVPQ